MGESRLKLSKGRFGVVGTFNFLRCLTFLKVRSAKHEEFRLAVFGGKGVRLLKCKLPKSFYDSDSFNRASDVPNLFEIQRIKNDFPRVLYILDELTCTGGVERRLEIQFDWLIRHGVQPIIVAERQDYPPLAKYPLLRFSQGGACSEKKLIDLIRWSGATVVEFNMKDSKFFQDVDLQRLRHYARIGCMIHGIVDVEQTQLDKLDYRCATRERANAFKNIIQIPNTVEFPETVPDVDVFSRRALYIGRLDNEKLGTVENFLQLCCTFGFDCDIAGPVISRKRFEDIRERYGIKDESILGKIDSRAFLLENGGHYAFVAGVGQVPLEAAALNIPSLVVTHDSNPTHSVFLTKDNLDYLVNNNCVLKNEPESRVLGNFVSFVKAKDEAANMRSDQPLSPFRMRDHLYAVRNKDLIFSQYLKTLLGRE